MSILPKTLLNEVFEFHHPTIDSQRSHMDKICDELAQPARIVKVRRNNKKKPRTSEFKITTTEYIDPSEWYITLPIGSKVSNVSMRPAPSP